MKKNIVYILRFSPIQLLLGLLIAILLPAWFFWQKTIIDSSQSMAIYNLESISGITVFVLATQLSLQRFRSFPGGISSHYIFPVSFFWFFIVLLFIKIGGWYYSFWYYCTSFILLFSLCYFLNFISRKYTVYPFAYIPLGRAVDMPEQVPAVSWIKLDKPQLKRVVSAIVVDLHSPDLDDEWEHFIAEKTLEGIRVYHHRPIRELLTGRVRIKHLYENELGSLLPSINYMLIKTILDVVLVILVLPIVILLSLIVAILIKLEDGGSIFYTQSRVGYRGKIIKVHKFRSMREGNLQTVTTENDDRITRVGNIIRKLRIDEIPQFINVLKGEMSLIGPRAEFLDFAKELEKEVPFFNYRHIVKPGISGWAQVNQGYTTGVEGTKIKVEHDFYYIKHFSFSLDLLIFFKTIHTMLTGFGAR